MQGIVDPSICVRCGMCVKEAPAAFRMGEQAAEGRGEIPPEALEDAYAVMEDCPVGAIRIE